MHNILFCGTLAHLYICVCVDWY